MKKGGKKGDTCIVKNKNQNLDDHLEFFYIGLIF